MSKIDDNTLNSNIEYCIDEYVRLKRDRQMMRDKWFEGLSLKELADKYNISETAVKKVIYKKGDEILYRASKMWLNYALSVSIGRAFSFLS